MLANEARTAPTYVFSAEAYRSLVLLKARLQRKDDARRDLHQFRQHSSKLLERLRSAKLPHAHQAQAMFEQNVRLLEQTVAECVEVQSASVEMPMPVAVDERVTPYQGYTPTYASIKNASVACSFG